MSRDSTSRALASQPITTRARPPETSSTIVAAAISGECSARYLSKNSANVCASSPSQTVALRATAVLMPPDAHTSPSPGFAAGVVSNLSPDTTLIELVGADHVSAQLLDRLKGRDHRASFIQMHFALDGLPEFAPPYEFLNEPGMQPSVGIFGTPEEQQRQWENACRGIVPDNPSLGMQIPSVHDPAMAPPGMHAASAYAYAFPVETPRDQHGHLKNEMADRVVEKISRYAPDFEDIQIRHITFSPTTERRLQVLDAWRFGYGETGPDGLTPRDPRDRDPPSKSTGYSAAQVISTAVWYQRIPGTYVAYEGLDDFGEATAKVPR